MQRSSRLLSGFITALSLLIALNGAAPVMAQDASIANRAISCTPGSANDSLTILTSSQTPLSAPAFQYLPGPDGDSILVADFPGLSWLLPPQVIRPSDAGGGSGDGLEDGIEEIRVGQFQESPPVCRVSVTTRNPLYFKAITFKADAGRLTVKWINNLASVQKIAQAARAQESARQSQLNHSGYIPAYPYRSRGNGPMHIVQAPLVRTRPGPEAYASPAVSGAATTAADGGDLMPPPPVSLTPHPALMSIPPVLRPAPPPASPKVAKSPPPARPSKNVAPPVASSNNASAPNAASGSGRDARGTLARVPTAAPPIAQSKAAAQAGSDGKTKGLFGKFFNHTPKSLTGSDQQSHDKLTSAEQADQQDAASAVRIKMLPFDSDANSPSGPSQMSNSSTTTASSDGQVRRAPQTKPVIEQPPVSLKLTVDEDATYDNLKIDVATRRKLSYKAFQLHNPERYVIDFDQLPELRDMKMPDSDSPLLYEMRAGKVEDNQNGSRLVLDLPPNENVQVRDQLDAKNNVLTLTLARLSAATASWSIPAAGPMKVPGQLTVVVDAGHGGSDPGAQRGAIQEKDITLSIAQKLKQALEKTGAKVLMTRSDDTFVSLEDRVKLTNQVVPDLFVSVHINALESTSDIHGIETYFQNDVSKQLADTIHQSLVTGLAAPDRCVRKARFYVINHTPVPAILAEVGYISNKDEREKLTASDYQDKIAQALARGVAQYIAARPDTPQAAPVALGGTRPAPAQLATKSASQGTTTSAVKSSSPSLIQSASAAETR